MTDNGWARALIYVLATIVLTWLALDIASYYFVDQQCGGGDCDVLGLYALGVAFLTLVAAVVGCAVAEAWYRRSRRR